jgi:predicted amidohydrolase
MKLLVAGAQIPITENLTTNFEAINRAINFAIDEKADILLTPEGSLSGYTHIFNQKEVSDALKTILDKVKGRLGLALGTCYIEEDGYCYDQIRFYDKEGEYLGFHSKTLLCSTLTDPPKGEIEHYAVKPLRTFTFKGIIIGGLICNDLWANPCCTYIPDPHLSQQLARMGVKVVFHAVNGERDEGEYTQIIVKNYHESNLRMRAKVGGIRIVTVDNSFPQNIPCSSPGGIINPDGNWVIEIPLKGEHFFTHTLEID